MESDTIETRWTCIECYSAEIEPHGDYCEECNKKFYTQIDGWLWFPLISLLLTIVSSLYYFFEYMIALGYYGSSTVTLNIMAIINCVNIIISAITLYYFLKRSHKISYVFYGFIFWKILAPIIIGISIWPSYFNWGFSISIILDVIYAIFYGLIWGFYFHKSKRVKKTFIY
ncbi:DUF2569 family protein [Providencia rettgeri]